MINAFATHARRQYSRMAAPLPHDTCVFLPQIGHDRYQRPASAVHGLALRRDRGGQRTDEAGREIARISALVPRQCSHVPRRLRLEDTTQTTGTAWTVAGASSAPHLSTSAQQAAGRRQTTPQARRRPSRAEAASSAAPPAAAASAAAVRSRTRAASAASCPAAEEAHTASAAPPAVGHQTSSSRRQAAARAAGPAYLRGVANGDEQRRRARQRKK